MVKSNAEALKKLDIDIENKLLILLDKNKKAMRDILEMMLSELDKRKLSKLMCDESYFKPGELLSAIQKTDEKILKKNTG